MVLKILKKIKKEIVIAVKQIRSVNKQYFITIYFYEIREHN